MCCTMTSSRNRTRPTHTRLPCAKGSTQVISANISVLADLMMFLRRGAARARKNDAVKVPALGHT
jgi:hypothetical protein